MVKIPEFDAVEFYNLSIKIAEKFITEAGYRTAIGRAYYACHLIGVDSTRTKGWFSPTNRREDHSGLLRALKKYGIDEIADQLGELCRLREHSDYHVIKCSSERCESCEAVKLGADLVDEKTWKRAQEIANNILPLLRSIKPSSSRA